jgi:hypothetical protein
VRCGRLPRHGRERVENGGLDRRRGRILGGWWDEVCGGRAGRAQADARPTYSKYQGALCVRVVKHAR